jgi:hypothetical protein
MKLTVACNVLRVRPKKDFMEFLAACGIKISWWDVFITPERPFARLKFATEEERTAAETAIGEALFVGCNLKTYRHGPKPVTGYGRSSRKTQSTEIQGSVK